MLIDMKMDQSLYDNTINQYTESYSTFIPNSIPLGPLGLGLCAACFMIHRSLQSNKRSLRSTSSAKRIFTRSSNNSEYSLSHSVLASLAQNNSNNPRPLEGKVALVTGAFGGLGKAITMKLHSLGAIVVGTAIDESGKDAMVKYYKEQNLERFYGIVLDQCNKDHVDSVVDTVSKVAGSGPDILVNNAGITKDSLSSGLTDDQWDQVLNTNLKSLFRLSKACMKYMSKAGWGRIVNMSSVVAFTGNLGQANYCAAKAGLVGMSKAMALELARKKITINLVAPGFIKTAMTDAIPEKIPMQHMGTPEDIANAVGFLASPDASYITGHTIHVNGGQYMS